MRLVYFFPQSLLLSAGAELGRRGVFRGDVAAGLRVLLCVGENARAIGGVSSVDGGLVADPPVLADPIEATRTAIRKPLVLAPIAEQLRPGSRVVMEARIGRPFFMVDAVLDMQARQIAVFAGHGGDIQPPSFRAGDRRTYLPWAEKHDVMVFGMPQVFHYGNGMGTNLIQMRQAISANIIRHRRVLRDLFQGDYHNILPDCEIYGEYFCS
jgi:hypothetical protein